MESAENALDSRRAVYYFASRRLCAVIEIKALQKSDWKLFGAKLFAARRKRFDYEKHRRAAFAFSYPTRHDGGGRHRIADGRRNLYDLRF